MAFRSEKKAVYDATVSRTKTFKQYLTDLKVNMEAGSVSANDVRAMLLEAIKVKSQNQTAAGTTGIVDYVQAQEGDGTYDVAAEWTAMNSAIDSLISQILSDIPVAGGGFVLTEQWAVSGISVRQFTTVQTEDLRTSMQAVIDTID